jgi:uncharacterized protein YggE
MTYEAAFTHTHARLTRRATAVAVGLLAGLLIVPAVGTARAQSASDGLVRSISVSGSGSVDVTPDVADVQLGVTFQRKTAKLASRQAARAMVAVVNAVMEAGVDEQDIQTTRLNLDARYERDPGGSGVRKVIGWEARNMVRVTVRDVDAVGDVIDAGIAAGATDVNRLVFRIDDPTEAVAQARSSAVAAAEAIARQLAADAGVEIVGVLTISEGVAGRSAQRPQRFSRGIEQGVIPTSVFVGSVDVIVSVFIEYEIA